MTRPRKTHGQSKTRIYKCWEDMLKRCRNPRCKAWPYYGGRGITVCERWLRFENFAADMGPMPAGMTLERDRNESHYEPGNCRWATRAEQVSNTRANERRREREPLMRADREAGMEIEAIAEKYGVSIFTVKVAIYPGYPFSRSKRAKERAAGL